MSTLSVTDGTTLLSTSDSSTESPTMTLREESGTLSEFVDKETIDGKGMGKKYMGKEKEVADISIDLSMEERITEQLDNNELADLESNDEALDNNYGESSSTQYRQTRRIYRKAGLSSSFYPLSDRNTYNFSSELIAQFDRYRMTMRESLRQELEELEQQRQNQNLREVPVTPTSAPIVSPVRSPSPSRSSISAAAARPLSTESNAPMKCFSNKRKYKRKGGRLRLLFLNAGRAMTVQLKQKGVLKTKGRMVPRIVRIKRRHQEQGKKKKI